MTHTPTTAQAKVIDLTGLPDKAVEAMGAAGGNAPFFS